MSNLIKFIKDNDDWINILQKEPYNLTIDENDNYVLLKYSQIKSDFHNVIVKECRGCIIDKNILEFACRPFDKFYNVQDSKADKIEWDSSRVQEKCDGSFIKIWWDKYNNKFQVSTMGKINANEAYLVDEFNYETKTFEDLVSIALRSFSYDILNKENTYMFEIMSPYNRVVVPHSKTKIIHLGTRSTLTGKEILTNIGIQKPKNYTFDSLDEILESIKTLPFNDEGYVVVDKYFKRVKIKGLAYLAVHRLRVDGAINDVKVLDLIKMGEHLEFLLYFKEYKEHFDIIENKYIDFINQVKKNFKECYNIKNNGEYGSKEHRKEYAKFASTCVNSHILFLYYNNKIISNDIDEYFKNLDSKKIIKYIW